MNRGKEYLLTTKKGEVINRCKADSLDDAILYFSIIKNLLGVHLLNIYSVIENGKGSS